MSTSIAISSAAVASSSVALAAAEHAEDVACQSLIATFNAQTSTTETRSEYARCVNRLEPTDAGDIVFVKIMIVTAFIFILVGAVIGAFVEYDRIFGAVMGAMMGIFAFLVSLLVFGAITFLLFA